MPYPITPYFRQKRLSPTLLHFRTFPVFIALSSVLFTYGIRSKLFYVNWFTGFSIILIGFSYYFLKSKAPKNLIITFVWMSAWLFYELFLTPFAINATIHTKYFCVTLFYVVVSILIVNAMTSSHRICLNSIFWSNACWVLVNCIFLLFYLAGYIDYESTFSGIFHNRNAFAVVSTVCFTLLLFSYSSFSDNTRKASVFLLGTQILLIITSLSLKGFIGLILISGMVASSRLDLPRRLLMFILIFFVLMGVFYTDNLLKQRLTRVSVTIENPEDLNIGESAFTRAWLITESLKIFWDRPLTGIGLNNSPIVLIPPFKLYLFDLGYIQELNGTYSHCNYTEMLLNGGIMAFLLYYGPIIWLLGKSLTDNLPKSHRDFIVTLCLYKLFLDVAMVSYFDFIHTFILAMMFTVFLRARNAKDRLHHIYT